MLTTVYKFVIGHAFAVVALWLSFWFVCFYPSRLVSIDEVHYVENARRILSGNVLHDCSNTFLGTFPSQQGCVSKYNLGTSVIMIPASLIDQRLVFVASFVMLLLAIWVFARILRVIGASPAWLLVFALYPPFIYFSRTAFSEIYSMALLLCVAYFVLRFWQSKRPVWLVAASFLAGFVVLTRYTLAVPSALILLIAIGQVCHDWKSRMQYLLLAVIAGLPWMLIIGGINLSLYGGVLHSGYWLSGEEAIALSSVVPSFFRYFLALNLMYPGMLVGSWLAKGKYQALFVLPVVATLLIYSLSPNNLFEGRVLDLILGIRFMIPVAPLIMLGSLPVAERLRTGKYYAWLLPLIVMGLFILSAAINVIHARFLAGLG